MARRRRTAAAVAAASVLLALVTACGTRPPASPTTSEAAMPIRQQQFATLLRRPTIDEIVSSYTALLQQIRDALQHTAAIGPWTQKPNAATSSCAPEFAELDDYDASRTHLPLWYAPTPASAEFWVEAKKTVTDIAGRAGFTTIALSSDTPGNYQLTFTDGFGAALSFGADKNVVLDLTTGCHLTAQAKTRGTPSVSPSR